MAMVTGVVIGVVTGVLAGLRTTGATHTLAVPAQDVDSDFANRMPGLGAFIVFAFLAVALYFLLRNMNARLRRMSFRETQRMEAEAAAQPGERNADGSNGDGSDADGSDADGSNADGSNADGSDADRSDPGERG